MDENSCIYVHHEEGYWECDNCGNRILDGKEWDSAANNCPICGKSIWFEDLDRINDFSWLF